jgi:hypothetical protein
MAKKAARRTVAKKAKTSAKAAALGAGQAARGSSKPGRNAEVIVRQGFLIDATGKGPVAVPEVVVLANADGFSYLAEVFADLAAKAKAGKSSAASAGFHLPRSAAPINVRLSDDIDFRFAPLTTANRRAMFKQFGIDMASKQKGSLFERYKEVLEHFGRLQHVMRREGLV